ncbi:TPA: hypothetical protein DCZ32_04705 [Candidatus Uhrbacteria bacterium]|nr:hypothetical protein [Candidatus Uhrbacteria bacterium]
MWHLIQGYFFQPTLTLSTAHCSETKGGVRAVVDRKLVHAMFAGVIFPDPDGSGLVGQMSDSFGISILSNIVIGPDILSFTKQYDNRPSIHYKFRKDGLLWVGTYDGSDTGKGWAKCSLTEVPAEIFEPPAIPLEQLQALQNPCKHLN